MTDVKIFIEANQRHLPDIFRLTQEVIGKCGYFKPIIDASDINSKLHEYLPTRYPEIVEYSLVKYKKFQCISIMIVVLKI